LSISDITQHPLKFLVMSIQRNANRWWSGQALMHPAQVWLKDHGVEYFPVKTLGSSRSGKNYIKTGSFDLAIGLILLTEFPQIWDENNPCLIPIKRL
jgi:hypothetical protein